MSGRRFSKEWTAYAKAHGSTPSARWLYEQRHPEETVCMFREWVQLCIRTMALEETRTKAGDPAALMVTTTEPPHALLTCQETKLRFMSRHGKRVLKHVLEKRKNAETTRN